MGETITREHALKTWSRFFQMVERGEKAFELRLNDRDFQVGDSVVLLETADAPPHLPTGNVLRARVTCVVSGEWLRDGYVALGIQSALPSPSGEGSALQASGFVLVPREATEEMKRAAAGHGLAFPDEASAIWSAMLAAASQGETK